MSRPAPARRSSGPLAKLALSLAVLASLVLLGEGLLRLLGWEHPPPPPIVVWTTWQDRALERGTALHVRHPTALWSLRPGAPVERPPIGVPESGQRVNQAGFRGPPLPLERTPGLLRVATLGDSSTFGYGVLWQDTWSARLVEELAALDTPAEVLCGGIVGYTVAQGVERYRTDVRPYRPDVVVAAFGAVNEHFPDALSDREKMAHLAQQPPAWLTWAREHLRLAQLASALRERFVAPPPPPPPGRVRVSLEQFGAELVRLAEAVREDGAALVIVVPPRKAQVEREKPSLPRYTARLRRFVRESGLPALDAHALFRSSAEGEDALLLDSYHPNPAGHALYARALAPVVRRAALEAGKLRASDGAGAVRPGEAAGAR